MKFQGNRIDPKYFSWSQVKFLVVLIPMAAFFSLPLIFIFVTSFKPLDELFAYPPRFFVMRPTLDNFRKLANVMSSSSIPASRYFLNSIVSTALIVVISVCISLSAGYTLAKKKFKAKTLLITINTLSLMFVPVAVTIPRYIVMQKTYIANTAFALVLPLIAMPVGLFLMTQFIKDIPDALLDSTKIDGATEYQILTRIVVPMVRPVIATVAILSFQSAWNAVEPSSLFVNSDRMRTFPYYLSILAANQGNTVAGAGMVAASTLVLFLPNLIIFILMQSTVMNTMAHSGIK